MSSQPIQILQGATWTAAGTVGVQALGLVTVLFTARALGPEPFGSIGMALVVTVLATTAYELALGPAIATGRLQGREALLSAHWLLCGVGLAMTSLVWALAPVATRFFGTALTDVLRALSVTLVLGAATLVPQALLQREGRFRALALLRCLNQLLIASSTLLLLAVRTDVWVLAVPKIVAAVLMVVPFWAAAGQLPRPMLDWKRVAPFLREAAQMSGYNVCNYFSRNADNAIVGKLGGERALGFYAFAYNLLVYPLEIFAHSLVPVLVPSFGRSRDEPARISEGAVRAIRGGLRLGAPVMIGGALTADLFVPLLFGPQWVPAVPLVQILMVTGALQVPGPVFGSINVAWGDPAFVLRWGASTAAASTAVFLVGALAAGAVGVAAGYLAYTAVLVTVMAVVARRRFGLPLEGLGGALVALCRDLSAMAASVLATGWALRGAGAPQGMRLAVEVATGALVYGAMFRLKAPVEAADLLRALPPPLAAPLGRILRLPLPSDPVDRPPPRAERPGRIG